MGACRREVFLRFVGQRASIMRSVRELKVNQYELMVWCSIRNFITVVRMALTTLIFRGIGKAPTFYGLEMHASRKVREQYARKIVDAYPVVV